jgi:hypothetical protein
MQEGDVGTKSLYIPPIRPLSEKGAELETKDKYYGRTPLLWAVFKGYEAVVKLLLEKGAELETKSNNGWTPLSWAIGNRHKGGSEAAAGEGR